MVAASIAIAQFINNCIGYGFLRFKPCMLLKDGKGHDSLPFGNTNIITCLVDNYVQSQRLHIPVQRELGLPGIFKRHCSAQVSSAAAPLQRRDHIELRPLRERTTPNVVEVNPRTAYNYCSGRDNIVGGTRGCA